MTSVRLHSRNDLSSEPLSKLENDQPSPPSNWGRRTLLGFAATAGIWSFWPAARKPDDLTPAERVLAEVSGSYWKNGEETNIARLDKTIAPGELAPSIHSAQEIPLVQFGQIASVEDNAVGGNSKLGNAIAVDSPSGFTREEKVHGLVPSHSGKWNPQPQWRTDADWLSHSTSANLTSSVGGPAGSAIDRANNTIPESYPLPPRQRSVAPVLGDAIEERFRSVERNSIYPESSPSRPQPSDSQTQQSAWRSGDSFSSGSPFGTSPENEVPSLGLESNGSFNPSSNSMAKATLGSVWPDNSGATDRSKPVVVRGSASAQQGVGNLSSHAMPRQWNESNRPKESEPFIPPSPLPASSHRGSLNTPTKNYIFQPIK